MPKNENLPEKGPATSLLRDLLIVELAKARIPQSQIREIVGCDIRRVNRIAKHFKKHQKASHTG